MAGLGPGAGGGLYTGQGNSKEKAPRQESSGLRRGARRKCTWLERQQPGGEKPER